MPTYYSFSCLKFVELLVLLLNCSVYVFSSFPVFCSLLVCLTMSDKRERSDDDGCSSCTDEDLDEQLLNLSKKKKTEPKESDEDVTNSSSDSDSDQEWSGSSKKTNSKQIDSVVKDDSIAAVEESSSEEEGEILEPKITQFSPDNSPYDDGFDDDLMGDEADRQHLRSLSEKDREQELFNRIEKREAMKTRKEIQTKLQAERRKEQEETERLGMEKSAGSGKVYSETISVRKESRRKSVDDRKRSAMDVIKEKRLQKKEKMDALIRKKELLTTKDVYSDEEDKPKVYSSTSSSSSEDENEVDDNDVLVDDLSQIEQIRLSRHKLEKWVHLPFFNDVVCGCFVKMGIGNHNDRSIYRVVEIVSVVVSPKIYVLGKTRTNKALKVRHGLQERVFRMEYISNQPFSESEFQKWKNEMKLVELPLPNLQQIKEKCSEIAKSKNYSLKEDDIENIVREKKKFRKNPLNYALKKNELLLAKSVAQQSDDIDTIESINKELVELEDRATLLDRQRSGNLSNVNNINLKNRKKNIYDAEKAVIEEAKEKSNSTEQNPFTRRRTLPKMITKNGFAEETSESSLRSIVPVANIIASSTTKKSDGSSSNSDMFNIHDFDVEIIVPHLESTALKATPKTQTERLKSSARHSLNLEEYKRRKGLI